MAREIDKSITNGIAARIFGEQPTGLLKTFFRLIVLSLSLWPIVFFVSVFFFDAPIRSAIDEICRWGAVLTIWLYPLYLFPLMRLWFRLSKRLGATWLFYFYPLIPVGVFSLFMAIGSSEYAECKPEEYDSQTFKRINKTYATDVNHVYYRNEILNGANPASFHALNEDYAADMRHVWFHKDTIEDADPATFVAPNGNGTLAHDAHDYYIGTQPLHVADMASFTQKDYGWAVDCQQVYYFGLEARIGESALPVGDYRTFRVLNSCYAADSKYVYYRSSLVEGADPESFTVLRDESHYAQDKNRVYCGAYGSTIRDLTALRHKNTEHGLRDAFHTDGITVYNPKLMPMPDGTDFTTIHRVEPYRDWYADKERVYYENRLLPKANPKTFKVFPLHDVSENDVSNNNKDTDYSHDGSCVYYRDSLMLGVDVPSFICGYDLVASRPFAFDKNRYYQGEPNPRLEKLRQGKCRIASK